MTSISIYLAWQNRASDKIIASFLSICLVGSAGTLASTIFSIKNETRKLTLTKSYIFHMIDKGLLNDFFKPHMFYINGLDHRIDILWLLDDAIRKDPESQILIDEKGNSKTIEKGGDIYRKICQAEIVMTLSENCNWMAKVKRDTKFGSSSISYPFPPKEAKFKKVTIQDFRKLFPKNDLLESTVLADNSFIIPIGTTIGFVKEKIVLKNDFVKIEIYQDKGGASVGAGKLASLAGLESTDFFKYCTASFAVDLEATFNPLKSGHPEMQSYRDWVDQIFDEFQYYFDSNKHWEMTKDSFHFHKDLPPITREESTKQMKAYEEWIFKLQAERRMGVNGNN